ncbi:MAG: thiol peroxidase [Bacteroidota bacterium]
MAQITLGGSPVYTSGDLPAIGTELKNYKLIKTDLSEVSISDYRGNKVILNIFPSIDTSVCASSVRKFNEEAASKNDVKVLCISKDLPFAHKRFCEAEDIENVEVLSDFRNGDFAEELGFLMASGPFQGLDARGIIILDEEGKVSYTELVKEIADPPNYEAALGSL